MADTRPVKLRNDIETWSAGCLLFALVALVAMMVVPDERAAPPAGHRVSPPPALPRAAAGLPAGIRVVPEPTGFVAREDLLAGVLAVPSGRLAVDDYWYGDPQVSVQVPPGRHPVRATIADAVGHTKPSGSPGSVALVTVVTGKAAPTRWRDAGTMGTDGGMGGFASAEAADVMRNDPDDKLHARQLDGLDGAPIAELPLGNGLNLFSFDAGLGDGGYGVYVGTDATGTVTRVVFDGALLHLAWPR